MLATIVWATDGSENADRALPFVTKLAADSGARVIVLYVNEVFTTHISAGLPVRADEADIEQKIARQAEAVVAAGVDAEARVVPVDTTGPSMTIAQVARDEGADVVVVATRGHTALGGLLVGSVTQRLLHISPCPVAVVPVTDQDLTESGATSSAVEAS
jgi:nucleotide-binding universal stress UspA family protein